jgi:phospholipid/cholesterol/gamma-HCH transport system substrate-binding protein
MSTSTNHWKLGLFVAAGLCGVTATAFTLGLRSLHKQSVQYTSYFDESVQGLDVGSPVKFRGVTIGSASAISVASDHRHVQVSYDLGVKDLNTLGLSVEKARGLKTRLQIPPDLRVQLGTAGVTGVKFLQLDFFEAKQYPAVPLPFDVPGNYIPTAPSMMKNLEDSVVHAVDRFPELADKLLVVLTRVSDLLGETQGQNFGALLGHLDRLLTDVHGTLELFDAGKLSRGAQETLRNVNVALANLNLVLARLAGDRGFIASAQRASDAVGGMAQNANHVGPALEDTMRDLQGAAHSIQRLADSLDLDPDMLIKGRAKRGAR